jgi:4-carboxymuconolactone decarboxylase
LAPHKVQALIAGLPTSFDDPRQQVVYHLTSALIGPRVVPQGLYQRARELLGDKGIVDVTVLLGWFTGVSLTLAAYDVPSHTAGLIPWPNNRRAGRPTATTSTPDKEKRQ